MTSRDKRLIFVVTMIILMVTALGLFVNRDRVRNWFDRERVDHVALARLERATLSTATKAEATAGWPQWRGPNRDGVAPAGPFRTDWKTNQPKLVWSVSCGGGYAQPVVVEDKLYLFDYANGKERLRCLDAGTGTVKWGHSSSVDYSSFKQGYASGPRATPTVSRGHVYTHGATGLVHCLTTEGLGDVPKVMWVKETLGPFTATAPTWGMASSVLMVDDLAVVIPGGQNGQVVALDAATKETRWTAGSGPCGYSSPILATIAGVRQIVAVTGNSILGIEPTKGTILWSKPWETQHNGNIATPIAVGDYVFVSSNYGKGCTLIHLESKDGGISAREVYFRKNRVMANHHMTCVYKDGFLYGCDGGEWACVDLKKGEKVADWQAADEDGKVFGKGNVTLVGDHLLGLTETGTLFLGKADPKEFTCLGQVKNALGSRECWAAPAVVDGRIYLRDGEKIVCYDVR